MTRAPSKAPMTIWQCYPFPNLCQQEYAEDVFKVVALEFGAGKTKVLRGVAEAFISADEGR